MNKPLHMPRHWYFNSAWTTRESRKVLRKPYMKDSYYCRLHCTWTSLIWSFCALPTTSHFSTHQSTFHLGHFKDSNQLFSQSSMAGVDVSVFKLIWTDTTVNQPGKKNFQNWVCSEQVYSFVPAWHCCVFTSDWRLRVCVIFTPGLYQE